MLRRRNISALALVAFFLCLVILPATHAGKKVKNSKSTGKRSPAACSDVLVSMDAKRMGLDALNARKLKVARQCLARAVKLGDKSEDVLFSLGGANMESGKHFKAFDTFLQLIELFPVSQSESKSGRGQSIQCRSVAFASSSLLQGLGLTAGYTGVVTEDGSKEQLSLVKFLRDHMQQSIIPCLDQYVALLAIKMHLFLGIPDVAADVVTKIRQLPEHPGFNQELANKELCSSFAAEGARLRNIGAMQESINVLRAAHEGLLTRCIGVMHEMAHTFHITMNLPQAIAFYDKIIEIEDSPAFAWTQKGNALMAQTRMGEAIHAFKQSLRINPEDTSTLVSLARASKQSCNWIEYNLVIGRVRNRLLNNTEVDSDSLDPFFVLESADFSAEEAMAIASQKSELLTRQLGAIKKFNHLDDSQLVSMRSWMTFAIVVRAWESTLIHLLRPLFARLKALNQQAILLSIQANGFPDFSLISEFVSPDDTIELQGNPFSRVAHSLNARKCHILIDAGGFHNRDTVLPLILSKPAPVQMLLGVGWPGTVSRQSYDSIIVDRIVAPVENSHVFLEKLAFNIPSYQINYHSDLVTDSKLKSIFLSSESDENNLSKLRDHVIGSHKSAKTMCNFNMLYKMDEGSWKAFISVLRKCQECRLILTRQPQDAVPNIHKASMDRGVDSERIIFIDKIPRALYLDSMRELCDVYVDTFEYNAHTVAADALHVGVPFVTLPGQKLASRVGASLAIGSQKMSIAAWSANQPKTCLPAQFVARNRIDFVEAVLSLLRAGGSSTKSRFCNSHEIARTTSQGEDVKGVDTFDSDAWVQSFLRLVRAQCDISAVSGPAHIVASMQTMH